jgi:hypothetical protein
MSSFFRDLLAKSFNGVQNWLKTQGQKTWLANQKKMDFREWPEPSSMAEYYPWKIRGAISTRSNFKSLRSLFALGLKVLIVPTSGFRGSESF